jgi:hypothetical protein
VLRLLDALDACTALDAALEQQIALLRQRPAEIAPVLPAGMRLSCGAELHCDEPFCPSCAQEHREAMAKPRATGYAATASLCTVAGAQYQQAALAPEHRVFG